MSIKTIDINEITAKIDYETKTFTINNIKGVISKGEINDKIDNDKSISNLKIGCTFDVLNGGFDPDDDTNSMKYLKGTLNSTICGLSIDFRTTLEDFSVN